MIEIYEHSFYLICKKCHDSPEVILNADNETLIISCNKCKIYENESLDNIINFSSEWVTNEPQKIICSLEHPIPEDELLFQQTKKKEIFSCIYCKTCNLFLCEDCLKSHRKDMKVTHEFIDLYKLRPNCCNIHNEKLTHYCYDCKQNICEKCSSDHKLHYIEKLEIFNKNEFQEMKKFENFIENAEKIKKNKYIKLNENIIWLQKFSKNDAESKDVLNNTLSELLKFFYNDLKMQCNLVLFAKILFSSCRIYKGKNNIIKQYNEILEVINKYFVTGNTDIFNNKLLEEKKKYIAFANRLTKEEIQKLKTNIEKIFIPKKEKISDFDKKKNFIEDNIEYSSMIKRYITKEKIFHPENFINIDETINDLDNLGKEIESENSNYVLSLIGKCVENTGTEISVSKKKDENFNKIELASIQSIFSLGNQKKYELHFDFGEEENEKIINNPEKKEEFLKNYKEIIAKELQLEIKDLIFTDVHHGSVGVHMSILKEEKNNKNLVEKLEGNN